MRCDGFFGLGYLKDGEHRIRFNAIPPGYTVTAVSFGGADLLAQSFNVDSRATSPFITVTLGPPASPTSAGQGTVVFSQRGRGPLYVEGALSFFRLTSGEHRREVRLGGEWCLNYGECFPAGPMSFDSLTMPISPGRYDVLGYVRPCSGNCAEELDRPRDECRASFTVKAGETVYVERVQQDGVCTLQTSTKPFR
jgi:hypothetical protein